MFNFLKKNRHKETKNVEEYIPTSEDILYQLYDWADERDYEAIEEYLPKLDKEHYIPAIMGICFSFLYNVEYEFPYKRAEEYLYRIKEQMKKSAEWYYNMAYALLYQKKYGEACNVACEGTKVTPECLYLWLIYSKALYCSEQKEAALKAAEQAMKTGESEELNQWIVAIRKSVSCDEVLNDVPYTKASNDFTMPKEMRMREQEQALSAKLQMRQKGKK